MRRSILLIVLLTIHISTVKAAFQGRVFNDKNSNGLLDTGELGINGVLVSDGLNVAKTDDNGNYKLDGSSITRFIFITVPAGFKTSQNHYLAVHSANKSYDFGLIPFSATANKTRFIQITDTETYDYHNWVENIRDYSANNDVGFVVHTGDICYEKGLKFHANNINTKTMGIPVFYCIGNHDLVKGDYGEQLFESLFGPVYYSFNAGNTHFIVTPMQSGDYKPSYTNDQVYDWLVNDLAMIDPSMNVVAFNHDLLTFDEQFIFKGKGDKEINLNDHNLKAWIYGHWHINFLKQHGDSGPISVCASPPDKGGIDHSPSNFLVYDIATDGEITITPRYSYVDRQLSIISPMTPEAILDDSNNLTIAVNTYHSIATTKEVKGVLVGESGVQQIFDLTRNSDWNWSTQIQVTEKFRSGQIKVKALFSDGAVVNGEKNFKLSTKDASPDTPKLKWISNIKANTWMAKPIEAEGQIFVAAIDDFGLEKCGIYALSKETGEILWYFHTNGSVKNTICFANGYVLATDHFGIAYAIDAASGTLNWKKELGQKALGAYISGNVVKDGIYYSGFGNYLQAIEVKTGNTIWINEAWNGGEGATSTMIIADHVLISGSNWRGLYAHSISDGKLLWKKSEDGYRFRSSTANYHEDTLFVTSQKGIGIMDAHSGEMYKYFETPYDLQVATKPIITDRLIIIGTSSEGLVAFDRNNGKEAWKVKTDESIFYSAPYSKPESATVEAAPVLYKDAIWAGASDGNLYKIGPKDGLVHLKMELGAPIFAPVTPTPEGFLMTDFGGSVYYFIVVK